MQHEFQYKDILVMIVSKMNPRTKQHCSECGLFIYMNDKIETPGGIFERRLKPEGAGFIETDIVEYDSAEESIEGAIRFMKNYIDQNYDDFCNN